VSPRRRGGGLPFSATAFEAAVQRAYVEQGITRVVGERVVAGRRALVTESVRGALSTDEPDSVTTTVVDAGSFALLERTTELAGRFRQVEVHELTETLPAGAPAARMAMTRRPGVPVGHVGRAKRR